MSIVDSIKDFLSVKFNLYLVIILIVIGLGLIITPSVEEEDSGFSVNFFYLPTCPHCAEQEPILNELEKEFSDINFFYNDASTPEGNMKFHQMALEAGLDTTKLRVPNTFVGKQPYIGVHTKEELTLALTEKNNIIVEKEISGEISATSLEFDLPFMGKINLSSFSIPFLAVILGLIDGFNPCAMWVLVYLIALLIEIKDKRKTWLIVGSFVAASGILYFLFMAAWLNVFLFLGYVKALTILIGAVALGGGILSVKEYLNTKEALECKVGDIESKNKTRGLVQKIIEQPLSIGVFFSIVVLAFVVNSVEFMCSSAIPAVFTKVLTVSGLSSIEYYAYILLYVFFFMLDDLIIFALAVFAINSTIGNKYAKLAKLVGGVILVLLGLLLLFAPQLLR